MSLCQKCNDLIQSAATNSILKKKKELEKTGYNESTSGKILTDPFVIMWVPEPESSTIQKPPKYYPPDPCCTEYDCTIDLITGKQECKQRVYPIIPKKAPQIVPVKEITAEPLPKLTIPKKEKKCPEAGPND